MVGLYLERSRSTSQGLAPRERAVIAYANEPNTHSLRVRVAHRTGLSGALRGGILPEILGEVLWREAQTAWITSAAARTFCSGNSVSATRTAFSTVPSVS